MAAIRQQGGEVYFDWMYQGGHIDGTYVGMNVRHGSRVLQDLFPAFAAFAAVVDDATSTVVAVSMPGSRFTVLEVEQLRHMSGVEDLCLCQANVGDEVVPVLQKHTALRVVDLRGTRVTPRGVQTLLDSQDGVIVRRD